MTIKRITFIFLHSPFRANQKRPIQSFFQNIRMILPHLPRKTMKQSNDGRITIMYHPEKFHPTVTPNFTEVEISFEEERSRGV